MSFKIAFDIDDVCPHPDMSDLSIADELHKEFGLKFTLFVPSNLFNKYPISEYNNWLQSILEKDYYEVAAHGHFHHQRTPDFISANASKIIKLMENEWKKTGYKPKGIKPPGYALNNESLLSNYDWIASCSNCDYGDIKATCSAYNIRLIEQTYITSHIKSSNKIPNGLDTCYERIREVLTGVKIEPLFVSQLINYGINSK